MQQQIALRPMRARVQLRFERLESQLLGKKNATTFLAFFQFVTEIRKREQNRNNRSLETTEARLAQQHLTPELRARTQINTLKYTNTRRNLTRKNKNNLKPVPCTKQAEKPQYFRLVLSPFEARAPLPRSRRIGTLLPPLIFLGQTSQGRRKGGKPFIATMAECLSLATALAPLGTPVRCPSLSPRFYRGGRRRARGRRAAEEVVDLPFAEGETFVSSLVRVALHLGVVVRAFQEEIPHLLRDEEDAVRGKRGSPHRTGEIRLVGAFRPPQLPFVPYRDCFRTASMHPQGSKSARGYGHERSPFGMERSHFAAVFARPTPVNYAAGIPAAPSSDGTREWARTSTITSFGVLLRM